jgi:hypothetical protein
VYYTLEAGVKSKGVKSIPLVAAQVVHTLERVMACAGLVQTTIQDTLRVNHGKPEGTRSKGFWTMGGMG